MKDNKISSENSLFEVNIKDLALRIWEHKLLFIFSMVICVGITIVYVKLATPIYEVASSILIDASGNNRVLSDQSQYLDGGVQLIETEKNLYNEIGILKSFSLVRQTVEDLGFNISYFSSDWKSREEKYEYFPFTVTLTKDAPQLYDNDFIIESLSKTKFRLSVEATKFKVYNPLTKSNRLIEEDFSFSDEFSFGEQIKHKYFNFTVNLSDYTIETSDFLGMTNSFIVYNYDNVADNYLKKFNVENINLNASIFRLQSQGAIIKKEIDFLTKLADNYIENKIIARNKIAGIKESFIRNQLSSISDSLANAELELEAFKKNEVAINLPAKAENAINQSQKLQSEIAKIEFNIKYYNSLIQYLEDDSNSERIVAPAGLDSNDPLLKMSMEELQKLYSERALKESYVTNSNQDLEVLNSQIKKTTESLIENLKNLIQSSELARAETEMQLSSFNQILYSLPQQEKRLLNMQRKSTLYENLFNYLSQELEEIGIARAELGTDTRVLDKARLIGSGPVRPKKMLLLVLAVIVGSIIPLGYIVFKNSTNQTIRSIDQIELNTNFKVIASIVHHNESLKSSGFSVNKWQVEESFRDLCANMQFLLPRKPTKIIGITSSMPTEGKTFCAINIAIKLAEAGKKVLIIDADLRNPSLLDHDEEFKGKCLSHYLNGEISSIKRIIHKNDKLNNFKFIPGQVLTGNIQEALSGKRIRHLVNDLKANYDYIVFDTPAVGLVSDYLLLSDLIDINLFVVRRKVSKISYLYDFEKLVAASKLKNNYIIFNDVSRNENKYGTYGNYTDYGKNVTNENHMSVVKSLSA